MRTKSLGVLFLVLMLASVWATYGVFTKKFTDYDEVIVHASKIGLQLPPRADVPATLFWPDRNGNLSRTNPNQLDISALREVPGGRAASEAPSPRAGSPWRS